MSEPVFYLEETGSFLLPVSRVHKEFDLYRRPFRDSYTYVVWWKGGAPMDYGDLVNYMLWEARSHYPEGP